MSCDRCEVNTDLRRDAETRSREDRAALARAEQHIVLLETESKIVSRLVSAVDLAYPFLTGEFPSSDPREIARELESEYHSVMKDIAALAQHQQPAARSASNE